jgi:hypothetical protein
VRGFRSIAIAVKGIGRCSVETRVLKHGRDLVLPQLRAHADMVDPAAFEWFQEGPARGLEFDIRRQERWSLLAVSSRRVAPWWRLDARVSSGGRQGTGLG